MTPARAASEPATRGPAPLLGAEEAEDVEPEVVEPVDPVFEPVSVPVTVVCETDGEAMTERLPAEPLPARAVGKITAKVDEIGANGLVKAGMVNVYVEEEAEEEAAETLLLTELVAVVEAVGNQGAEWLVDDDDKPVMWKGKEYWKTVGSWSSEILIP